MVIHIQIQIGLDLSCRRDAKIGSCLVQKVSLHSRLNFTHEKVIWFDLVKSLLKKQNWSIFGPVFEAVFTDKTFHLQYRDEGESNATLTLTEIRGPNEGNKLILPVKIVELRPKLFMITWQEPNMETVTEIEDYENGFLYANITSPKDHFFTLKAELRKVT